MTSDNSTFLPNPMLLTKQSVKKSKANPAHWVRRKQLSSNEEASRGLLSNRDNSQQKKSGLVQLGHKLLNKLNRDAQWLRIGS